MAGAKPQAATLVPFFAQYDRRTAVYFPTFTAERWATEEAAFVAAQRDAAALAKRTVDVIQLGEQQPEQDHAFASNQSALLSWDGRPGPQADRQRVGTGRSGAVVCVHVGS